MLWVEWRPSPWKVHMTQNHLETLCEWPIPRHAVESTKPPRDKARICKVCQKVEREDGKYRRLL